MSIPNITKIVDGDLKENSPEGYVITSEDWNAVMTVIKEAVNNNAMHLSSSSASFKTFTIATTGADYNWNGAPRNWSCTIPQKDHGRTGEGITVQLFNNSGEEVYGGITIHKNNSITISSRIPERLLCVIKGANT